MSQESYEKDGETCKAWRLITNQIEFLDNPNRGEESEAESDPLAYEDLICYHNINNVIMILSRG
jgi:hypothetical protein